MSNARSSRVARLIAGLRHAFALGGPHGTLAEADRDLLRRLAQAINRRGMSAAAVLFLESIRPLGYLGSQAMVFLQPFLTFLFSPQEYERLAALLERREGVGLLIDAIEAAGAQPTPDVGQSSEDSPGGQA